MGARAEVRVLYADTSALVRAYFEDEDGHPLLAARLLEGEECVVTSEIFLVEVAAAAARGVRAGRLGADRVLDRIEADCEPGGPIALIELAGNRLVSAAEDLALRHGLRALDAVHLATCLRRHGIKDEKVVFITRDDEQAAAARAEGLTVE
jgi:uncharacterized protein